MANDEEIIVDAAVWEPEQEDHITVRSCKKCGNTVPTHYEFCPYCKNRLKKKKRKKSKVVFGLVITLLSLSTIASTLCAIIYRDWYVGAIYDKNIVTEELDHITDLYNELKQKQGTSTSAEETLPIASPSPTVRQTPQPTAAPTPKPQPKVCAVESCSNPLDQYETHIYCNLHECEKSGCMGYRDDPLSAYCVAHRCVHPGCHAERFPGSDLCIAHKYE